eukprot:snap_masked-scaffold_10-processed-gene-0.61-mRNA-1 protein AED:1.00 eAED:1.00 QI:0/0/0/0/1/1/5/0/132
MVFLVERDISSSFLGHLYLKIILLQVAARFRLRFHQVRLRVNDVSFSVPLSEFKVFSIFHGNGALRFPLFPYYPFCLFESFMDIILCHSCIYSSYLEVQPGFVVIQDSFSVRDFHSLLLISNRVSVLSEDVL